MRAFRAVAEYNRTLVGHCLGARKDLAGVFFNSIFRKKDLCQFTTTPKHPILTITFLDIWNIPTDVIDESPGHSSLAASVVQNSLQIRGVDSKIIPGRRHREPGWTQSFGGRRFDKFAKPTPKQDPGIHLAREIQPCAPLRTKLFHTRANPREILGHVDKLEALEVSKCV